MCGRDPLNTLDLCERKEKKTKTKTKTKTKLPMLT